MTLTAQAAGRRRQAQLRRHGRRPHLLTPPLEQETEITGPSPPSCSSRPRPRDADLFLVLRVFSADLQGIIFQGAIDPHTPVAQGWLRASHRKLDPEAVDALPALSHPRREAAAEAGRAVELDIEIWPTSIVVPAGYRVALTVRGKDYEYGGASGGGCRTSRTS